MRLVSSCICLCPIYWSQVLSREWRCSWSSADRRCSNYIWVINNLDAYLGASYIRDLVVDVVGWNHYCHLIILILSCALCFCHNVLGHVLAVCSIPLPMAWWRHQMETISALLALCAGNSRVTGEFPTQRPVTRSFDDFFDLCLCVWTSGWANTRAAGDLRRHRANYDVTVMASRLRLAVRTYLRALWQQHPPESVLIT